MRVCGFFVTGTLAVCSGRKIGGNARGYRVVPDVPFKPGGYADEPLPIILKLLAFVAPRRRVAEPQFLGFNAVALELTCQCACVKRLAALGPPRRFLNLGEFVRKER